MPNHCSTSLARRLDTTKCEQPPAPSPNDPTARCSHKMRTGGPTPQSHLPESWNHALLLDQCFPYLAQQRTESPRGAILENVLPGSVLPVHEPPLVGSSGAEKLAPEIRQRSVTSAVPISGGSCCPAEFATDHDLRFPTRHRSSGDRTEVLGVATCEAAQTLREGPRGVPRFGQMAIGVCRRTAVDPAPGE